MNVLPRVVRPKWKALCWRWRRKENRASQRIRDGVIICLTLGLAALCYRATHWVLGQTETALDFAYLPPSLILGLILVLLSGMLLITNTVAATGALYLSADLELLLSSPLRPIKLYGGKLVEIVLLSSWMSIVFLLPMLLAFANHYSASWQFYLACLLLLIPYFVIPAALGAVASTAMTLVAPWIKRRELAVAALVLLAVLIWHFGRLLSQQLAVGAAIDLSDIIRMVSFLSITNTQWVPSHWVSSVLGRALTPGISAGDFRLVWPYIAVLYSATWLLLSLAYLTLRRLHFPAYSRAGMLVRGTIVDSKRARVLSNRLLSPFSRPTQALLVKEYRLCMRDLTQVLQFVMLLGLCAMYIYLLSFQTLFESAIPTDQRRWWKIFLVCTNICIESFVITAMGTRLVYPSISREGRSYWVLENAPLRIAHLLRVKFWFWVVPLALICSTVFTAATVVMYGSLAAGFAKFISSAVLCAALVSLGLGCGSYFAKFDWEHPSELIAGFGSLVYMIASVFLILLNLCGFGLVVYLRILSSIDPDQKLLWDLVTAGALLLIAAANISLARWSLGFGARALIRRTQH